MRAGGPRVPSGDMTLFGVYYGMVTQNKDDEGKCRVKVRLPWLDQGDTDQTHWAQVATPMSGPEYGWYTIPDVGDVVALMFIGGDIAHPVVLGGIWSKTDNPPEDNSAGKNEFRGYRSRAGSRVVLDDSSNGKVYFADKTDKNAVVVGSFQKGSSGPNARHGDVPPAISGSPQSGVSIASMEGEVNLTAKGKLKVDAQNIEITSKSNVDIKAGGNAEFDGGMNNMNGGGASKLEGSSTKIN
jgi:uncharacterized protein involved in type VI secretion and phage assembly